MQPMGNKSNNWNNYFNKFKSDISNISLPVEFTFPFNYQAHPLCKIAATELQEQLRTNMPKGKMYGVLLIETKDNQLGYLSAVSGNNNSKEIYKHFVPPIYDLSNEQDFYRLGESELTAINQQIEHLENDKNYTLLANQLIKIQQDAETDLKQLKSELKASKTIRHNKRKSYQIELSDAAYEKLNQELIKESQQQKSTLNKRKKYWKTATELAQNKLDALKNEIQTLKKERKEKSFKLQQQLFNQYHLLNANNEQKSLLDIFQDEIQALPPAAAGECAAPKLLQFAFTHNLKPLAMAEFWWGPQPKSEVRKQGNYYPSCQSKCKPILGFMLQGLNVEPNPLKKTQTDNKSVDIIFEDDHLLVISKPHGLLSVPGKTESSSVYAQMKSYLTDSSGPLIVHRLDMATSGLMLIAKTKDVHEHLQKQFLTHSISKVYIALLDGIFNYNNGIIELPLRTDLDNRPQQLVCFEHGKPAKTKWEIVDIENGKTRIKFSPITGRTHQLRVHAAHHLGLNMPIVGDELYGTKADRLYLHAEQIEFVHPILNKEMSFTCKSPF